MVFLSERDQFSIDLYLADATTGRISRKLLTTATKAEVESLQYLHSSGAWDRSGSNYALGTVSRGRATLVVLDLDGQRAAGIPADGGRRGLQSDLVSGRLVGRVLGARRRVQRLDGSESVRRIRAPPHHGYVAPICSRPGRPTARRSRSRRIASRRISPACDTAAIASGCTTWRPTRFRRRRHSRG